MTLKIRCDACDSRLTAPEAAAGKKVTCPKCGTAFRIEAKVSSLAEDVVEQNPKTEQVEPDSAPVKADVYLDEEEVLPKRNRNRVKTDVIVEDEEDEDEEDEPEKVKFLDPMTSLFMNIGIGLVGFSLGFWLLFCFWPLGILVMIVGIAYPIYGMAVGSLRGPCPYCEHTVTVAANELGMKCPACKKRFVVRKRRFHRVD